MSTTTNSGVMMYRTSLQDFLKQFLRPEDHAVELVLSLGGRMSSTGEARFVYTWWSFGQYLVDQPCVLVEFVRALAAGAEGEMVVQTVKWRARSENVAREPEEWLEVYGWHFADRNGSDMHPDFARDSYRWDFARRPIKFLHISEPPTATRARLQHGDHGAAMGRAVV